MSEMILPFIQQTGGLNWVWLLIGLLTLVAIALVGFGLFLFIKEKQARESEESTAEKRYNVLHDYIVRQIPGDIQSISEKLAEVEARLKALAAAEGVAKADNVLSHKIDNIRASVNTLENMVNGMPVLFKAQLKDYFEEEERRRLDEEEKAQAQAQAHLEEERLKRDEEVRRSKEAEIADLNRRLEDLTTQSDFYKISFLTNRLVQKLEGRSPDFTSLKATYDPYIQAAVNIDQAKAKMSSPYSDGHFDPAHNQNGMEAEVSSLERKVKELIGEFRPGFFIDLIEVSSRFADLQKHIDQLETLLGIEEIRVKVGDELPDQEALQVVRTDGIGDRIVINEVLGNGYVHKESGTVLRKPIVKLCLKD